MKKTVITVITLMISTLTCANTKTVYIADSISLPVRMGPGVNQKITNRLLPGTKVKILNQDEESKYAQVEWAKGKSGWVSARVLTSQKPAIARLKIANLQMNELRKKIALLSSKTEPGKTAGNNENDLIATIKQKINTQDASINRLQTAVENLTRENSKLTAQIQQSNAGNPNSQATTDNNVIPGTEIDWFLWGGFMVGLSFGAGILITKIRWRKDRLFS